jgi:hypothetical protein
MSADELKTAVEDYGRRLVALPEEARKLTDTTVVKWQPARAIFGSSAALDRRRPFRSYL